MKINIITIFIFSFISFNSMVAQCNLEIRYDEAGNRIFRGNECDPECSTHVSIKEDIGVGSIRNAIFCAADGDYITFAQSLENETILLESGEIVIDKSLQINQSDQIYSPINVNVRSASDNVVFEVMAANTVIFQKVNMISNPGFNSNPRVLLNHGTLTLQDLDLVDDGLFQHTNNTFLNNGNLTILETVKLIYAYYQ